MKKKIIKVATFNVENLILPDVTFYGKRKYSKSVYEKKIDWIANQLKNMDADVVGFQEVFQKEALQEAVERSGIYPNAEIIVANPNGKMPRVAFVSKFPIENHEIYADFPENSILDIEEREDGEKVYIPYKKFSRPILRADIKVHNDFVISFYATHLKSKRPNLFEGEDRNNPIHLAKGQARSLILRTSEAVAFRSILADTLVHSNKPVVIMGDMNDVGHSVTSNMISGESPHRRLPFDVKKQIWDNLLYHVKDLQARKSYHDFYYTHIHNGHYDSLDHIMVSQELVAENPNHIGRVGYVSLFNDHLVDQTLSNERPKNWRSDHGQVVVTIELDLERIDGV